jgi:hypothetical protein
VAHQAQTSAQILQYWAENSLSALKNLIQAKQASIHNAQHFGQSFMLSMPAIFIKQF